MFILWYLFFFFFFNDTATTEIYTLSLHDALPIYVDGHFKRRANLGMVDLEPLDRAEDIELVRDLIRRHIAVTGSTYATRILDGWVGVQPRFVKVMPKDYRRILLAEIGRASCRERV